MLLGTNAPPLTEGGIATVSKVDPATPNGVQPAGQTSGWTLTMSEEFNGQIEYAHAPSGHIRMRPDGPLWRGWWPDYFHSVLNENPHTAPLGCVHVCTLDNLDIVDGHVSLIGKRLPQIRKDSPWPGFDFTSGALSSQPGHNQVYGYYEARIRTPGARYWPAFWMLPETITGAPYEIDIFEGFHVESVASTQLHPQRSSSAQTNNGMGTLKAWHTYAVKRTPTQVVWYYDGVQVAVENNTDFIQHMPMYVLLVLQINPPPYYPDPTQPMPTLDASMDIDYVRCWEAA